MKLVMIGVGYVGLVTAACLAEMGHHLQCIDINPSRVQQLSGGSIPIYEPGLQEIVKRNLDAKRISFTTNYHEGLEDAEVIFIAVDTPTNSAGAAETTQVEAAARMIGRFLQTPAIIATKSTVPVGTTYRVRDLVQEELSQRGVAFAFDVISNPEFMKEGNAVNDVMKPDRVIVGIDRTPSFEKTLSTVQHLYAPFMLNHDRLMVMDIRSSELTKYAANAMLATRISFMNELARLCEQMGADISWIRKGIGSDERIGTHFLYPGPGFGGSCLPKDIKALLAQGRAHGIQLSLVESVLQVNETQKQLLFKKIRGYFGRTDLSGLTIGILGLSFKPNTDDMREAPSLDLIRALLEQGASVRLFDPVAMENAHRVLPELPGITWCQDELDAGRGADALVLVTEWKQFRWLDFPQLRAVMRGRAFFDGRNQYSPLEIAHLGFDYMSIGRPAAFAGDQS